MDKFFDFVKNNPAVIALIPASIQALVSLLTLFKKRSQSKKNTYSNNNSGNQINSGSYSTNTINDYSNRSNTTINNNQTYNSSSSSDIDIGTAIIFLLIFSSVVVIAFCFYLENKDIILASIFIFVFASYFFNLFLTPRTQRSIIETILCFIFTALCYFLISSNCFKPLTFDVLFTQIISTTNFVDKGKLVYQNQPTLYYIVLQIGALAFLSVLPLYDVIKNIKFLTSNNSEKAVSPIKGVIVALIFVLIPAILFYFFSSWWV